MNASSAPPFVHPSGICESRAIGRGTSVWAFAHVLAGASIGADCNICDHVFIENDVVVGDRVTVKCGVQLWDGVRLEDDVFIGPNATFTNDLFPRSKIYPDKFAPTIVRRGASIGANATILAGVTIGVRAMVGAGAVVTRSLPPYALAVGNPARVVGFTEQAPLAAAGGTAEGGDGDRRILRFGEARQSRGTLTAVDFADELPFRPERAFLVHGVPAGETRGGHAHLACHQVLIAAHGSLEVMIDDGAEQATVRLDTPSIGLHLPPRTWSTQYGHSLDAVLLVYTSHAYDRADYIEDYEAFREIARQAREGG